MTRHFLKRARERFGFGEKTARSLRRRLTEQLKRGEGGRLIAIRPGWIECWRVEISAPPGERRPAIVLFDREEEALVSIGPDGFWGADGRKAAKGGAA